MKTVRTQERLMEEISVVAKEVSHLKNIRCKISKHKGKRLMCTDRHDDLFPLWILIPERRNSDKLIVEEAIKGIIVAIDRQIDDYEKEIIRLSNEINKIEIYCRKKNN